METTILYLGAGLVVGLAAGIVAGRVSLSKVVTSLNDAVNVLRGDDVKYKPRENAHWALGEFEEHADEVAEKIEETPKPDEKKPDAKPSDEGSD